MSGSGSGSGDMISPNFTSCPLETLNRQVLLLNSSILTIFLTDLNEGEAFLLDDSTITMSTSRMVSARFTTADDMLNLALPAVAFAALDTLEVTVTIEFSALDTCTFNVSVTAFEEDICTNSGPSNFVLLLLFSQSVMITVDASFTSVSEAIITAWRPMNG